MMEHGVRFRVRVFGSSHGPEVGAIVEGVPKGTPIDPNAIQADLDRRAPVGRRLSTRRREPDRLILDSGVEGGRATGGPIRMHVANVDVNRAPYADVRVRPRPGHADYPAAVRFGALADLSGGGIFSGRMTVGLVAAGALARSMLREAGVEVAAFSRSIGGVSARVPEDTPLSELRARVLASETSAPGPREDKAMARRIAEARRAGDSVGGVVECRVTGIPVGVGEPFFGSVESEIAHLAFAIPGVKGIEFGAGFSGSRLRGSQNNDAFYWEGDRILTRTQNAGGILGGLTFGGPITFRVAVKPTPSIARRQETVDLVRRTSATIRVAGRHDPCIVPRAVVVVEAVAAIALVDLMVQGGFHLGPNPS
ncbi:MAG: chorismate synthase [Thermoplasmata archaeon]|nr:chorismate synthase [Thermoplasmata archaeon]